MTAKNYFELAPAVAEMDKCKYWQKNTWLKIDFSLIYEACFIAQKIQFCILIHIFFQESAKNGPKKIQKSHK